MGFGVASPRMGRKKFVGWPCYMHHLTQHNCPPSSRVCLLLLTQVLIHVGGVSSVTRRLGLIKCFN